MFNTLLSPAPCGSGLNALHEAPSVPYNSWTDDNAKALGSLAYVYPNFATQDQELLSFIQHNDINGYLIKRCQQITPQIVNSSSTNMTVRNNLYIFKGNPTLAPTQPTQQFRVSLNENPLLSQAYIQGQTASINGTEIGLDTGVGNIVNDSGFSGNSQGVFYGPWAGAGTLNTTYYHSPPSSLQLTPGEAEQQSLLAYPSTRVNNFTLWATTNTTSKIAFDMIVFYTNGANSTFSETVQPKFASAPGNWTYYNIAGSQLNETDSVSAIGFKAINGTVFIDDTTFDVVAATVHFDTWNGSNGQVVMQHSVVFQNANLTIRYTLVPNRPYLLVNTTLTDTSTTAGIENPTIYNALDGLNTINTGYAWMYFPGIGWERPQQSPSNISVNYLPSSGWNQNWLVVGVHGLPDWVGTNGIFIDFNQTNLVGGSSPFHLDGIINTLFQNSTYTSPGDYLAWLQLAFNDGVGINPGQSVSYQMKYVFTTAYDWTSMPVYSTFLNGTNIDSWNNTNIGTTYMYGEVANDLALYAWASGAQSSPAFPLAEQVWNYYYRMIQAENNGTYTASLARFVNASNVLYQMTGNSTYLAGLEYGANLLETVQNTTKGQFDGEFTIAQPKESANPISAPIYYLDLTALGGDALKIAYQATGNSTYLQRAELALSSIHYGSTPPSGYSILGFGVASNIPTDNRLFVYANSTAIDTDYFPIKSVFTIELALGLNNTLANIAMSRVWQASLVNSTFVEMYTAEMSSPTHEMNSETQPWALAGWLQYDLYWQNTAPNHNFPLYVSFANEQGVIENFSAQIKAPPLSSVTNWMVNGSGLDTFYDYTGGATPSNVTFNGASTPFTYPGSSIPGQNYVSWQSQLGSPDNFTITFLSSNGGGGTTSNTCVSSATPTITNPVIYAQIGKTTISNVTISNAGDNASALIGGLTFVDNNTGTGNITISTYSGLPQTVEADNYSSFKLQVTILNGTKPGTYKEFATSNWNGICANPSQTSGSSGQIGFGITIIAQNVSRPQQTVTPWYITYWWAEAIIVVAVLIAGTIAVMRFREED